LNVRCCVVASLEAQAAEAVQALPGRGTLPMQGAGRLRLLLQPGPSEARP
jgi:hypothetical protein